MATVYMNADGINLLIGKHSYHVGKDHVNYDRILALVRRNAKDKVILPLVSVKKGLASKKFGGTSDYFFLGAHHGVYAKFSWAKEPILMEPRLSKYVERLIKAGFPVDALLAFAKRLYRNSSYLTVARLFGFLEKNELPIEPDGRFLAFIRVGYDYRDVELGIFDNSVGQKVRVARNSIPDYETDLDFGFHVCSFADMDDFFKTSFDIQEPNPFDKKLAVKVDPVDVVFVPGSEGRQMVKVCAYEVVDQTKQDVLSIVEPWLAGNHEPDWARKTFNKVADLYRLFYAPKRVIDFCVLPDSVIAPADITAAMVEDFCAQAKAWFPEIKARGPLTEADVDAALRDAVDSPRALMGLLSQMDEKFLV